METPIIHLYGRLTAGGILSLCGIETPPTVKRPEAKWTAAPPTATCPDCLAEWQKRKK